MTKISNKKETKPIKQYKPFFTFYMFNKRVMIGRN